MADGYNLARFVQAQAGVYPRALAELQAGTKVAHWMWFVFPQMLGLGNSRNARLFAIAGLAEARAYAAHGLLGPRLLEATGAMLGWAGKRSALDILGVIDAMKFHSSMSLFERACPDAACFPQALEAFHDGMRDAATLERVGAVELFNEVGSGRERCSLGNDRRYSTGVSSGSSASAELL